MRFGASALGWLLLAACLPAPGSGVPPPAAARPTASASEPEPPANPEVPRKVDCHPPACRWLLEEAVDVSAPQAVAGDVYARGLNRVALVARPDGTLRGGADFWWTEWSIAPECSPRGVSHQAVQARGRLVASALHLTLSRADGEFHLIEGCPGSKGLQLIELPQGDVSVTIPASAGSTVEAQLRPPLHGSHRYVLLDPSANDLAS